MISFLIAAIASLPFLLSAHEPTKLDKRGPPCLPDTVEVIEQQILAPDTTMSLMGAPIITYKIILCYPPPGSPK